MSQCQPENGLIKGGRAAIVLSIIYYKTQKVEVEIIVHYLMNLFIASLILWAMYRQCILETQKAIYYLYF